MKPRRRASFGAVAGASLACTLAGCWFDVPDVASSDPTDSGAADSEAGDARVPADATDALVDGGGGCNPDAAFGAPLVLPELANPNYDERYPRLSPDERTIYYSLGPPGGPFVLFFASRAAPTGPFGNAAAIAGLTGGGQSDVNITVSSSGLVALMSSTRTQQSVNPNVSQIWSTLRQNTSSPFAAPIWSNTTFGSQNGDFDPYFVPGAGGHFYYANLPINGSIDLNDAVFNAGVYSGAMSPGFGSLNSAAEDRAPVVTPDELRIYFASNRGLDGGVLGSGGNVWTSTRPSSAVVWQAPRVVSELAGFGSYPRPGWISADGCRLYLTSNKAGSEDVYVATRGH